MKTRMWIRSGVEESFDKRQERLLQLVYDKIVHYYDKLYETRDCYRHPLSLSRLMKLCNRSGSAVLSAVRVLANTIEKGGATNPRIYYERIVPLLRGIEDVAQSLDDRDLINEIFGQLRGRYAPATYATYVSVSMRFVRWLNDGERPKGFKDVKPPPSKLTRRTLEPHDMVKWDEGLMLAEQTTSLQMKAILLMQLDGGFRPSEFIDLRYGDVSMQGCLVIVHVRDGKTGSRSVVLHRSVPYFMRWYQAHPTKSDRDPLWIVEGGKVVRSGHVTAYRYAAIRKRILELGKRVQFPKPLDFYNLRHSSCALDKCDNVPVDLAAQRHGHSVKYYDEVYGRLSIENISNRFRRHYRVGEEETQVVQNQQCSRCQFTNEPDAQRCYQCSSPLTIESAMSLSKQDECKPDASHDEALNRLQEELVQVRNRERKYEDRINALEEERQRHQQIEEGLLKQNQNLVRSFGRLRDQAVDMAVQRIHRKLNLKLRYE